MCVNHITSPLKFSVNLILMWFFTQWALELWNVFLNNAAGSEFYIMFKGRLDRYLEKGRGIYLIISKYTNPTRIWKVPEQKIVRGRETISAKVQFFPVLPHSCVWIYDYSWSQMGIMLFFPLYATDHPSIFFSEFFCSNFSPSNTVLDDFY